MTGNPVLLIAGQGRCGMTAMMLALHAGGVPCAGEWPAFEPAAAMFPIRRFWLRQQCGKAVKVLSPHMSPALADVPRVVIEMRRDRTEQAKSAAKMMQTARWQLPETYVATYAAQLRKDDLDGERVLHSSKVRPLAAGRLSFETLVTDPATTMRIVADFIAPWWRLDPEAAAQAIVTRSPACAPDLAMEMTLVARAADKGGIDHA